MRPFNISSCVLAAAICSVLFASVAYAQSNGSSRSESPTLLDDFESNDEGELPDQWVYVTSDQRLLEISTQMDENEWARVQREDGRAYLRTYTQGEAMRISLLNEEHFNWDLQEHPWFEWKWRIQSYPEGAAENNRRRNDTAAAMYVTFGSDWLGRPKSIKYTFSSSLPVGTTDEQGPLRVMVIDSANKPGLGQWKTMRRNIRSDYRQLFGENPPNNPISITIWNDSDTISGQTSEADFDAIRLLPPQ